MRAIPPVAFGRFPFDRKHRSAAYCTNIQYSAICIMVTILGPLSSSGVQLPFYSYRVPAGFPSPAADHLEQKVSLDELLDLRAPHTYLVRIEGDSMIGAGIFPGDLAIVDRSQEAESGHIVIAAVDCEPVCKRLVKECGQIILKSENPKYPSRYMMDGEELQVNQVNAEALEQVELPDLPHHALLDARMLAELFRILASRLVLSP